MTAPRILKHFMEDYGMNQCHLLEASSFFAPGCKKTGSLDTMIAILNNSPGSTSAHVLSKSKKLYRSILDACTDAINQLDAQRNLLQLLSRQKGCENCVSEFSRSATTSDPYKERSLAQLHEGSPLKTLNPHHRLCQDYL